VVWKRVNGIYRKDQRGLTSTPLSGSLLPEI
jgi:hypothetical protein